MSNPSVVSLQLTAAVANGICLSQQPAAAGALALNGSLVANGVANLVTAGCAGRRVSIASTGNDSTVVFTVNGTNQSGAPISSAVTGVATPTAVETALDFATVTSIVSSAGTAGNITAGTNATASTPWVLDNFLAPSWYLAVAVSLASGTATFTVEHTYDDPNTVAQGGVTPSPAQYSMEAASYVPPLAWPNPNITGKSANTEAQYAGQPIMAHRLTVTAGIGLVIMQSVQAGIGDP